MLKSPTRKFETVLQFSGGKDSLACLHMFQPKWDEILVCWLDTGASYPDVLEYMEGWKKKLPNFHVIKTDQPRQIRENGFPCDVLPMRHTAMHFNGAGVQEAHRLQSYFSCCGENRWIPMHREMIRLGVKQVVRGTRADEVRGSIISNGYVDAHGIQYTFPIEGWSEEMVWNYLRSVGAEIPSYYEKEVGSRNCWDCTAYLDENLARIRSLEPGKREVVKNRLRIIDSLVKKENLIPKILGD